MPCEACNIQFTVFKRKRSCTECRRLYCSNCLTRNKERILCKRCVIFTARPLSKIDLLKLKAKDLIFYLQSNHISTTGCVEKEELVNLILIHVDNSNDFSPVSQSSTQSFSMGTDQNDDLRSNPFDQIRNTCQNLFTTFTERIATDFNLDFKQNQDDPRSNVCGDQPRYSNNFQSGTPLNSNGSSSSKKSNKKYQRQTTMTSNDNPTINSNHSVSTSTASDSSNISTPPQLQSPRNSTKNKTQHATDDALNYKITSPINEPSGSASCRTKPLCNKLAKLAQNKCCSESGSGCDCSDDELIIKFRDIYCEPDHSLIPVDSGKILEQIDDQNPNNASTSSSSTKTKEDLSAIESSDISSFEDLGAVGGISMNEIQNVNDADKWQIVNNPWAIDDAASTSSIIPDNKTDTVNDIANTTNLPNSIEINESSQSNVSDNQSNDQNQQHQPQSNEESNDITFQSHSTSNQQCDLISKLEKSLRARNTHRKLTRRQSDGIVYTATTSNGNRRMCHGNFIDGPDNDDADEDYSNNSDDRSQKRSPKSCHKCGKTRGDLKKYIERFRHQLETTTNFSDTEIRRQLDAFLEFLEIHSRNSFDSKDDDNIVPHSNNALVQSPTQIIAETIGLDAIELEEYDDFDDEAGIHVYGSNDDTASSHPPRLFFDLNSIGKKQDLDELNVKQLKEILMLNRVDFKGCCEKSELLERVQRLWDDLQNCPAVEKLPTVDLCKICMDAAIECVLLECGHMATCTNCGKVLSECPICRQYIVRVVRFFKA